MWSISFNIYGIKLNQGHFSRTVFIHFLAKPFQEKSFKSHLYSVLRKNTVRFSVVSCDLISFYLLVLTFAMKLENADYKGHWNIFSIWRPMKNYVRFEYVPWKKVWFCFASSVLVQFSHKTEIFRFWKSLNILIFFDKKMMSDFIISCQTVSDLL